MRESNVDGGKFDGRHYKVSVTIAFWYFCPDLLKTKQTILNRLPSRLNAPFYELRKPIYIFGGERNFNQTGKPNNWRKNSFDAHENTAVPVLTRMPFCDKLSFVYSGKYQGKMPKLVGPPHLRPECFEWRPGWKTHRKKRQVPEKRAQNTQKEPGKILRNKANGSMKVPISLRSDRFRFLVAKREKREKRGKRLKVLIVQLCLGVVPRCAALAIATILFVIVQLFIRALDGL